MFKVIRKFSTAKQNPFNHVRKEFTLENEKYNYFSLPDLKDARVGNYLTSRKITILHQSTSRVSSQKL